MALSFRKDADVAQVVAHLIGSEEVTGPSPVISSLKMVGIWENPGSYFLCQINMLNKTAVSYFSDSESLA